MLTSTLAETYARIVDFADIGGQDDRHPPATVKGWSNDSYRNVRTWSVGQGFRDFITEGSILNLPAAPSTNETYGVIPLPASVLSVQGLDVFIDGCWRTLEQVDWEMRRRLQSRSAGARPMWFAVRNRLVLTNPTTGGAGEVAYFPFSGAGQYRLFTLEEWTTITNDAHLFVFPAQAWLDAVCYEAALKVVALKDGDNTKRANWLRAQLDDARANILATLPKLTETGPKTMRRDTNYRSGDWWR